MHKRSKKLIMKRSFAIALSTSIMTSLLFTCASLPLPEERFVPEQPVQVRIESTEIPIAFETFVQPVSEPIIDIETQTTETLETNLINDNEMVESNPSNNAEEQVSVEPKETQVIEQRENKHYYVLVNDYRSDLPVEYQDYLWELCKQYDVTKYYELFIAQMYRESSFKTRLISGTNDYGLMQINSQNHDWLRKELGITSFLDSYQNIKCGVHMMSKYLHKYNDVHKALVCYNMGESRVRKGIYSSNYSRRVVEALNYLVEIDD